MSTPADLYAAAELFTDGRITPDVLAAVEVMGLQRLPIPAVIAPPTAEEVLRRALSRRYEARRVIGDFRMAAKNANSMNRAHAERKLIAAERELDAAEAQVADLLEQAAQPAFAIAAE